MQVQLGFGHTPREIDKSGGLCSHQALLISAAPVYNVEYQTLGPSAATLCIMNTLLRPVLLIIGTVSLGLGVLGMFVPILPTTPFLLLAAFCFGRSSERLHHWLIEHPRLGAYVVGFLYGGAVPRRAKRAALLTLWPGIALSIAVIVWRVKDTFVATAVPLLILAIAIAVTVFIVTRPECGEAAEDTASIC